MTKRRRLYLLAAGLTAGMAAAAACSFPEPQLVPDGTTEAGTDAIPDARDADGGSPPSGETEAQPPIMDATTEKPAVDANCNVCDCDDDGFATKDAAACPDAGAKPRTDCDDLDKRANPDAGFITDQPTVDTLGDWNCDGKVNGQYPVGVNCADYGGLLSSCGTVEGFVGNPGCGEPNTYAICKVSGVSCVQGSSEIRKQGCK